ncbi:hypothetical protein ATERTT37_004113 [Aspergillus terreus]
MRISVNARFLCRATGHGKTLPESVGSALARELEGKKEGVLNTYQRTFPIQSQAGLREAVAYIAARIADVSEGDPADTVHRVRRRWEKEIKHWTLGHSAEIALNALEETG